MSQLDKVELRVSPLSKDVLIARFGKDPETALETKVVNNDFLSAVIQYVGENCQQDFSGPEGEYSLTLIDTSSQPRYTDLKERVKELEAEVERLKSAGQTDDVVTSHTVPEQ